MVAVKIPRSKSVAALEAKLAAAESESATLRAHVAALRQCLADVLATVSDKECVPYEAQLVRMRAKAIVEEVES